MFRGFDDDPFFRDFNRSFMSEHQSMMRDMDRVMGGMLEGFNGRARQEAIEGAQGGTSQVAARNPARRFPFSGFGFPDMGQLHREINDIANKGDGYSYSSSQVYSYRNDGNGQPQEYQAVSSSAYGPGGIKETRKGYKDSSTKTKRMQYGRHIGDRATLEEAIQQGDKREEKTDYLGFTEDQAPQFDKEWGEKAGGLYRPRQGHVPRIDGRKSRHHDKKALPAPK